MEEIDISEHETLCNIEVDGELRVSFDQEMGELYVYADGRSEPVGRFRIDDGTRILKS